MRFLIIVIFSVITFCILPTSGALGSQSSVLGRTVRLDALCADFENENWLDDYNRGDDYWHDTPNPSKRGPEHRKRVTTPPSGRPGSSAALEIGRISDPKQHEVLSPAFSLVLGYSLKREHEPVFIVRVEIPPFDKWGGYGSFGFRQESHAKNISYTDGHQSVPSIWVKNLNGTGNFYFRAANESVNDVPGPLATPGWWTLAIAFDDKGIGHYDLPPI